MLAVNRRAATDLESFWAPIAAGRAALVAGLIAFLVYASGLSPLVHTFDPAQFQTLARTGGIAHSGYPTLVLLLQLFGELPFGTLAWRANLLSAVSGAVAVGLLAYMATRFTRYATASVVAALVFALSLSAWKESTLAGVHMFTLALGALLVLVALRYAWWPSLRDAIAGAFLFGLGLTSHLTVLGVAPVLALAFAHGIRRSAFRTRHVIAVVLALACGLAPFVTLIMRDRTDQPMNYLADTLEPGPLVPSNGEPSQALRIERARWLVSGAQYLGGRTHDPGTLGLLAGYLALCEALNEFPFVTLPFALLGLGWLVVRSRGFARWLLLWLATALVLTGIGATAHTARFFFLPGAFVLAIGIAHGLATLARRRVVVAGAAAALLLAMPFVRLAIGSSPAFAAALPVPGSIWQMWPQDWRPWHAERRYDEYGRGVMARVPSDAVVLGMGWDESTTLRYFVYGEPLQPGVDVRYTGPREPRLSRHVQEAIAADRPVYVAGAQAPEPPAGTVLHPVWDSGWRGLWRLEPAPVAWITHVPTGADSTRAH